MGKRIVNKRAYFCLGILAVAVLGVYQAATTAEAAKKPLFNLESLLAPGPATQPPPPARQPASQSRAEDSRKALYAGYSARFQPVKSNLISGKTKEITDAYTAEDEQLREGCQTEIEFRDKVGMLGYLERGSVALILGFTNNCRDFVGKAEEIVEERERESIAKESLTKVGSVAAELMGIGEQGRYFGNGFERVMMLNVKAISFLLDADSRAYNVARLAITWQDEENEKFQAILDENQRQQDQEGNVSGNSGVSSDEEQQSSGQSGPGPKIEFLDTIQKEFAKYDAKALEVPSAYVNPFGDYLAGAIQEFKSQKDPSLKSNALISYQRALSLNPNSPVIKSAVTELGNPPDVVVEPPKPLANPKLKKGSVASKNVIPKTEGMLHVIGFDGFVPERKILPVVIRSRSSTVTLKVPVYDSVPNMVSTINVSTSSGAQLAELTTVADLEALCLRHQKDSVPLMYTSIMASGLRDMFFQAILGGISKALLGNTGRTSGGENSSGQDTDTGLNPDTRSWMSLPSSIKAARISPPVGLKEVTISTHDSQGKQLSARTVQLNGTSNNFVFVRSMGQALYVNAGKPTATLN